MSNSYDTARDSAHYSDISTERLDGVRTRRILSFCVDYFLVFCLTVLAAIPILVLGVLTFGLAWLLLPVLGTLVAVVYVGMTMGGPRQSTLGMRFFSLRIESLDGRRVDAITAVVHGVIFWAAHIVFTPLLLIVSLFNSRKQLIQDILLGTVVVRSDR